MVKKQQQKINQEETKEYHNLLSLLFFRVRRKRAVAPGVRRKNRRKRSLQLRQLLKRPLSRHRSKQLVNTYRSMSQLDLLLLSFAHSSTLAPTGVSHLSVQCLILKIFSYSHTVLFDHHIIHYMFPPVTRSLKLPRRITPITVTINQSCL